MSNLKHRKGISFLRSTPNDKYDDGTKGIGNSVSRVFGKTWSWSNLTESDLKFWDHF